MRRLFALFVLLAAPAWAATYYVKNGGNDGAAGTSDATAWATMSKVNGTTFVPGDSILFKRGSLWRGTMLTPHDGGTSGHQITYGNYDSGALPIISMAILLTGWTNESGNLWYATLASDPGWVFMDNNVGDYKTTKAGLVNEYDFFWDSGASRLYVYSPSSPATHYTSPGVEYRGLYALQPVQDYITIDGICFEKAEYGIKDNYPGSHWVLQNCLIRYCDFGMELGNGGAYSEWDIRDNEVSYCNMIGLGPGWAGTNIRIYRNQVHHIDCATIWAPGAPGSVWTSGIKFFAQDVTNGMSGSDVYENYVHDCGRGGEGINRGVAIWPDTVHPDPANPIKIHHNLLVNCSGAGVDIEISSDCHAYGNIIWNCGTDTSEGGPWADAGVTISGRLNFATSNNLVYNNTIYGSNIGINAWQDNYNITTMRMDNNIVKNNIVYGYTNRAFSAGLGGDNVTYGSGNVYEYNCFGPQQSNFIEWGYQLFKSTYAAWESAYGGSTHSINADPKLNAPASGDFTLQASSPCIDVATNLGATYKYDLLAASTWPSGVVVGDQGSYGSGWEIGAYIYEPSAPTPTPTPTATPNTTPYVLIIGKSTPPSGAPSPAVIVGILLFIVPGIVVGRRKR